MKISTIITTARIIGAASLLSLSFGASAATTWTWAVNDFGNISNIATATAKNISAWSTTGTSPTGSFTSACLHNYGGSGWGIVNNAEANPCSAEPGPGPHAADNVGTTDLFLLQFDSAVSLNQINIGWNGTDNKIGTSYKDSDISVLAYTGGAATAPLSGLTTTNLTTNGWFSIGNYANVGASNNTATSRLAGGSAQVVTNVSSSWWLISAYSSKFGTGNNSLGENNDYFKLLSVAGTVAATPKINETPEPGSLALAALGLLGIAGLRRRAARR